MMMMMMMILIIITITIIKITVIIIIIIIIIMSRTIRVAYIPFVPVLKFMTASNLDRAFIKGMFSRHYEI